MKILVIDDNQDNLTTLKAVVADRLPAASILTALSGAHGLALARAEDPDVILLDIVMPDMDGYEVCSKLKEDAALKTIPVLFLTALRTDRDSRIKALEMGAEGFLSKPLDAVELCAQIQSMARLKAGTLSQLFNNQRLATQVAERTWDLQRSQLSLLNLLEDLKAENSAREISEQALRDSEQNYRMLFAKMLNGFALFEITWDPAEQPVDYRFIAVNPAFERMTGLNADEIVGQTLRQALPGSAQSWIEEWAPAAATGQPAFFSNFAVEGGKICEVAAFRTVNNQFACVFEDITDRKHAAEALAARLDELRRWQAVTLGREDRIGELKREVNALATSRGEPPPYEAVTSPNRKAQP